MRQGRARSFELTQGCQASLAASPWRTLSSGTLLLGVPYDS